MFYYNRPKQSSQMWPPLNKSKVKHNTLVEFLYVDEESIADIIHTFSLKNSCRFNSISTKRIQQSKHSHVD